MSVFLTALMLVSCLFDPCRNVDCSNFGYCEKVEGEAVCMCDPGHSGEDCSECTWAGPGEPCEPEAPGDLFDMEALAALDLDDLAWSVDEEWVTAAGVRVIVGSWSGGIYDGFDRRGRRRQIDLRERAALYLPPDYPSTPNPGKGLVFAVHTADSVESEIAEVFAEHFRIPMLHHGEEDDDWRRLGFNGRNEMIEETFVNLMAVNPCEVVSLTRGNFGYVLARTNIMAVTLLERLVETNGGAVDEVALRGGSKEGFATWLASAVDGRIEVAAPGGYQTEDLYAGLAAYARELGVRRPGAWGRERGGHASRPRLDGSLARGRCGGAGLLRGVLQ